MTTPSTERKAGPLLGTGAQTTWPFTFKVFAATDIAVTIADSLGVETALVYGVDYTVTLNANQETSPGGTVTYPISGSPLPVGSRLVIVGNLPYDQPLDLPSGGNFSPLAIENQLDRMVMQIQQLRERVARALQVSVTTNANVALPPPAASQLIGWSSTGDNLENVPLSELGTAITYGTYRYDTFTGDGATTNFALSEDPAVLANLDVSISGVVQVPGTDYSLVTGNLVFASAPPNGALILARYGQALTALPDSDQITFVQAGAGATTRTVQGKLREHVSAFDFMSTAEIAVVQAGTESLAVHAALQAAIDAIDAAGGGALFLPAGVYRLTSPLLVPYGVSIYGEGGTSTTLSCLNCDGINFDSGSYDGGLMLYADFAIRGASGSSGNWAAVVSTLRPGGTFGVDSRDGLYFDRLRIYDFNQAFVFNATWESHINECRVFRCNQAVSLGNYCLLFRITDCNFTYEGGFPSGAADRRGVELLGAVTEGTMIRGCQIFGYPTVLYSGNAIFTLFEDNDIFGTVYGVNLAGAVNTGMSIRNNYFEISANNAVGIRGAPQSTEISNLVEVFHNAFVTGGAATGTRGIVVGDPGGTYQWNWRIRDNHFVGIQTADIQVYNAQNVVIDGNRFESAAPTNNITIVGGAAPYHSNYVTNNRLAKGISADSADVTAGRIMVYHNIISGAQSFGEVVFDQVQALGNIFTFFDGDYVNTGSNFDLDYVLPDTSLHLLTLYMETAANTHLGPGVYAVVRQGTSTSVTAITAFAGVTVTVTGAYKLNVANATGANGVFRASLTKTMSP